MPDFKYIRVDDPKNIKIKALFVVNFQNLLNNLILL